MLPAMLVLGAIGGALWGLIPAFLRVRSAPAKILTSLMLVYVAQLGLDYLVRGPWRDPQGFNFPQSVTFDDVALMPLLMGEGRLHAGIVIALLAVIAATFVLGPHAVGFSIELAGSAPRAAAFAGFDEKRVTYGVFAVSGALAGLAGIIEVAGPSPAATDHLARLRLHRHHRRHCSAAAPVGILLIPPPRARPDLYRRRGGQITCACPST